MVVLTTHRSVYWEGGPPFLVLGPSGAVQIGNGTLVLPWLWKQNKQRIQTGVYQTGVLNWGAFVKSRDVAQ